MKLLKSQFDQLIVHLSHSVFNHPGCTPSTSDLILLPIYCKHTLVYNSVPITAHTDK